jgi:hypothetical protein
MEVGCEVRVGYVIDVRDYDDTHSTVLLLSSISTGYTTSHHADMIAKEQEKIGSFVTHTACVRSPTVLPYLHTQLSLGWGQTAFSCRVMAGLFVIQPDQQQRPSTDMTLSSRFSRLDSIQRQNEQHDTFTLV